MYGLHILAVYARVSRVHTLVMSVGPIICSYLYCCLQYPALNSTSFIFVAISIILFHLSVNTISEYRDCLKGIDDDNVNGPQYRLSALPFIRPITVLRLGLVAFALAGISGLIAVYFSSIVLLVPGLIGAGLALFYSEWPIGYKYKALGEIGVFMAYGPLLVFSCIFSLTNNFSVRTALFSIPFGLLTMCVVLANNIRDFDFDHAKIRTLPSVIGLRASYVILFTAVHLSFAPVLFLICDGAITKMSALSLLGYPVVFASIKTLSNPKFVDVFGVMQVVFCSSLAIGLLHN